MISQSISLRDDIQSIIETATGCHVAYQRATKDMQYPYIVFDLRRIGSEVVDTYVLEVNAWDQNKTASRISIKMDQLEKEVNGTKQINADRTFTIRKGPRETMEDENKDIRRVREQFELQTCERS